MKNKSFGFFVLVASRYKSSVGDLIALLHLTTIIDVVSMQ